MQKRQAFDRWKHQGNMVWSISELAKAFGTGRRNLLMRVEHSGGAFDDTDTYVLPRGTTVTAILESGEEREIVLNGRRRVFTASGVAKLQKHCGISGLFLSDDKAKQCSIEELSVFDPHEARATLFTLCSDLTSLALRRNLIQNPAARAEADQQIIALARTICAMATAPDAAAFAEVVQIGRDITDV